MVAYHWLASSCMWAFVGSAIVQFNRAVHKLTERLLLMVIIVEITQVHNNGSNFPRSPGFVYPFSTVWLWLVPVYCHRELLLGQHRTTKLGFRQAAVQIQGRGFAYVRHHKRERLCLFFVCVSYRHMSCSNSTFYYVKNTIWQVF